MPIFFLPRRPSITTVNILHAHRLKRPDQFVFDMSARNLAKGPFKVMCRTAGVTVIRFHDLRHTFASHLVMAGTPIYTVKTLLGHSTVTMTERYSHLVPDHLRGVTDVLCAISIGVQNERRALVAGSEC